jgi:tRNA threonylcarbamoyladenosine modification (KEOPS) complex  Pcc1 subunit
MQARAHAELTFKLDSASEADALEAALRPEPSGDVPGCRASIARDDLTMTVTLRIEAEHAGALRAGVNAYLRWAGAALELHRLAQG